MNKQEAMIQAVKGVTDQYVVLHFGMTDNQGNPDPNAPLSSISLDGNFTLEELEKIVETIKTHVNK